MSIILQQANPRAQSSAQMSLWMNSSEKSAVFRALLYFGKLLLLYCSGLAEEQAYGHKRIATSHIRLLNVYSLAVVIVILKWQLHTVQQSTVLGKSSFPKAKY